MSQFQPFRRVSISQALSALTRRVDQSQSDIDAISNLKKQVNQLQSQIDAIDTRLAAVEENLQPD